MGIPGSDSDGRSVVGNRFDCRRRGVFRRRSGAIGCRRFAHGKHLWHFGMGEGLTASPITYAVDGKQYVAIASATAIFSFGLFEPAARVPEPKVRIE